MGSRRRRRAGEKPLRRKTWLYPLVRFIRWSVPAFADFGLATGRRIEHEASYKEGGRRELAYVHYKPMRYDAPHTRALSMSSLAA